MHVGSILCKAIQVLYSEGSPNHTAPDGSIYHFKYLNEDADDTPYYYTFTLHWYNDYGNTEWWNSRDKSTKGEFERKTEGIKYWWNLAESEGESKSISLKLIQDHPGKFESIQRNKC